MRRVITIAIAAEPFVFELIPARLIHIRLTEAIGNLKDYLPCQAITDGHVLVAVASNTVGGLTNAFLVITKNRVVQ
jgi:hypothetical protein